MTSKGYFEILYSKSVNSFQNSIFFSRNSRNSRNFLEFPKTWVIRKRGR